MPGRRILQQKAGQPMGNSAQVSQLLHCWRLLICSALALLTCSTATALLPPMPSHQFFDLVVGARGELLATHTDGVFLRRAEDDAWRRVLRRTGHLIDAAASGVYLAGNGMGGDLRLPLSSDISHSTDGGATWTHTGSTAGLHGILAHDGSLYGCAGREIRRSRNGGKDWVMLVALPENVGGCKFMRFGSATVYVFTDYAFLFAHRLRPDRWELINGQSGPAKLPARVRDLHVDAIGTLYASAGTVRGPDGREVFEDHVYRSRDQGSTWRRIGVTAQYTAQKVLALREGLLYVECMGREAASPDVCVWSEKTQSLRLAASRSPWGALRPGLGGRLYQVVMTGVFRWSDAAGNWVAEDATGTPDPQTGAIR